MKNPYQVYDNDFLMHAYLITGTDAGKVEKKIRELVKSLKAKPLEFPLNKIEDVRVLGSFVNLSLTEPTAIIVREVDEATIPAQNAFLKALEEPQERLTYILTARSTHPILPTILSRCQTLPAGGARETDYSKTLEFIKMSPGEKLAIVDKIHTREEAVDFTEDFVFSCHELLHKTKEKHLLLAKFLKVGALTLTRLKASGNVTLQLTNMVVNLT